MRQKQAAEQLGAGVSAVYNWGRTYRKGSMAALQLRNRNDGQADKPASRRGAGDDDDVGTLHCRVEELESGVCARKVAQMWFRPSMAR
ncbi:IS3 family transposase [Bifidobacterium pullorum subsp. gallinarum]|uniref:IS3 family transposase n=1 Tax=Bifidobacterium pullorum subsp. gallinarum TaxID=78344 RepID=A0A087ASP4_9BIFI|nr:hypothetical protein [Bifidobacterium pullorum]KFI61794.1 IS3 family transposase [Bifidobacterium pullorum subsp. gallinarum]